MQRKWVWPILVVLLCVTVLSPYGYWYYKKPVPLKALILDKTVPVADYREHKGLMWILNNLKLTRDREGNSFRYAQDYYGFFPLSRDNYDIRDIPSNSGKLDLIYLADSYGVYTDDFYTDNVRGDRSELMYGGLSGDDVTKITKALGPKTVLVAEFNILASPTGSEARHRMEKLLGVEWQAWTGRYFTDLDPGNSELPTWLIRNYERQYKTAWKFKGPGFAYVSSADRVVILRVGQEVGGRGLVIQFKPTAAQEFGIKDSVPFYYWFDVVQAQPGTEVLGEYHLDVTPKGQKLLAKFGLPTDFPAVLRKNSPSTSYYFAGDFADNSQVPERWNYAATPYIRRLLVNDIEGSQNMFFWNMYYPLVARIAGGAVHAQ
ncbi:MAG TPA: hypothetical protein VHS59_05070 [Bacillota bacterium]|nr:hypothetical protein [Bacillota bacterium]